jgi:hypothetical protein
MSFCQIMTRPCGKAKCGNIVALFPLIRLKMIYLARGFIVPAIHLFINSYSYATAAHLPIIYIQLKLSVKLLNDAGEPLRHPIILFFHSFILLRFYGIDHHQEFSSLSLSLPCSPNQSGDIRRRTHILLL